MKKSFAIGVLTLSSLCILSAKTYQITITSLTKAGTVQLKAGQYTLKVQGNNAVFTSLDNDKSYTVPVKVEAAGAKFDDTQVQSTKDGDTEKIQEIDLGGSTTKLGF